MRILFIEDNVETTQMIRMLLEMQGHSVLISFSGSMGIELAAVAEPDLIIVDLGLPDIDGVDVIASVYATCRESNCTIATLTGKDDLESRRRASEAGASSYFVKSDDISKLLSLTGKALNL